MLGKTKAYSSFSVDDLPKAKEFYGKTLGLDVTEDNAMSVLMLRIPDGGRVMIYPKGPAHKPATYTVLNFPVEDIEKAVDELSSHGIRFQRYDGFDQDAKGIARAEGGPAIAWFTDPSGNIISILQER